VAVSEADVAAKLIERLLAEPDFRARFRRDPAAACREAGLEQIAQEMAMGAGKAMMTLDVRESKSSLAGVLMAAAMEGVGLYQLSEHVLGHLDDLPAEVGDVLSRVNLPVVHHEAAAAPVAPVEAADLPAPPEAAGDVVVDSAGLANLRAEKVDHRVVSVLSRLSRHHEITVARPRSDRGVDIVAIDGRPVSASNFDAREIALELQDLDPSIRPNRIGTPWAISGPGYVTGADHQDHLHISFKEVHHHDPVADAPAPAADPAPAAPVGYPGEDASKPEIAAWMAAEARKRGLPGELPVMASLVESGMRNINYGDADSVGFFQMRVGIWNQGAYAGYPDDPQKQIDWFLDHAEAVKQSRTARGLAVDDPKQYGDWIADVERPAEQYRGRYQLRLGEAQSLLKDAPTTPVGAAPVDAAPAAPVDPAQFGAEATGGAPSPETQALLNNHNVIFDSDGIADLKAGRIDPREVAVLTKLSEDHKITVSCMCSDHSKFTAGGSVSNHHYGRGVDIAAIDGVPVNASNFDAREIAMQLQDLDPSIRPSEIGTPWAISGPGYFTDAAHQNHLHIGFDTAISPDWKPPADLAAAAPAPAAAAARPGDTLSFAAPSARLASVKRDTLSFVAADTPHQAREAPAPVEAAADAAPVGGGEGVAGAKALAALTEAKKYLGTPYQWGGSTPQTHFDCSGLVQWSYAQAGIQIPRVTDQQILAANGSPVKRDDLLPGDLVFFRDPSGYVHHVGMSLGGDKFIHAPHTGDVVKISSLDEPYYAQQFTGGRRFDAAGSGPAPEPADVAKAQAHVARDAAEVRRNDSMLFAAVKAQEAAKARATVQFLKAVDPERAKAAAAAAPPEAVAAPIDLAGAGGDYPGNDASQAELAKWLAARAEKAGLPPELPVMAALVESGVKNLNFGDADSVGFFQMRVGIWNQGAYAGFPDRPELQAKWFIDNALAVKRRRIAAGDVHFGKDPSKWGEWIADVERPAAQYRGRYQLRLGEARGLLG
jgi:cell wall-associated NlpC family hydrolase